MNNSKNVNNIDGYVLVGGSSLDLSSWIIPVVVGVSSLIAILKGLETLRYNLLIGCIIILFGLFFL